MIKVFSKIVLGLWLTITATAVFSATSGDKLQVADNAPDSYVVKRGDTLWAISGKFLKQPWRWPEVWKLNREQIHNPHLIYPGQVVVLDRNGPSLSIGRSVSGTPGEVERLSPRIRESDASTPISSISMDAIRAFLAQPLVSEVGESPNRPTVVAIQEDRVVAGTGDSIYAKGIPADTDVKTWDIYRRTKPIANPFNPKDILGYEAQYVATARVTIPATDQTVAELEVLSAKNEINSSDRLMPTQKANDVTIPPHAPSMQVDAGVAEIYDGVGTATNSTPGLYDGVGVAGRNSVIAISAGKNIGIEPGHVLALIRNNGSTIYRGDAKPEVVRLPDSRIGLLYIFRVFNRVSYGLIVESSGPVKIGDKVTNP
jgi:hypothetical protein